MCVGVHSPCTVRSRVRPSEPYAPCQELGKTVCLCIGVQVRAAVASCCFDWSETMLLRICYIFSETSACRGTLLQRQSHPAQSVWIVTRGEVSRATMVGYGGLCLGCWAMLGYVWAMFGFSFGRCLGSLLAMFGFSFGDVCMLDYVWTMFDYV